MKRLLREPLVHFLLIGAALFAVYGLVGKGSAGSPATIVITKSQIASLATDFSHTWQRSPTPDELEGLIQDRLREEVYYREAMALGLDKDDAIVRHRLRQKMEFISEDVGAQPAPTDAELEAYLQAHADAFRAGPRFAFRHVFLKPDNQGANLARDAARLLAQLTQAGPSADVSRLGDPFPGEHTFDGVTEGEVAAQFGEPFVASLLELPTGRWQGPVASGFGAHLIFIDSRAEGGVPALAEVRDAVRREWVNSRRLAANETVYRSLLEKYKVTIERR
jgi:hypothetical protein